jgi:hypothetical protein
MNFGLRARLVNVAPLVNRPAIRGCAVTAAVLFQRLFADSPPRLDPRARPGIKPLADGLRLPELFSTSQGLTSPSRDDIFNTIGGEGEFAILLG